MGVTIRRFNEDLPEINGVSMPVELQQDHTGLTISEIQVSLIVVHFPNSENYILASDVINILEELIAGKRIIIPDDMELYKWLKMNLCTGCHDEHKIQLRPERRQYAIAICESLKHPDE